ncbi:MAG: M20/M25/M40 family metallo-hydrolase, partial [bacterium]|nr:M20/M25/M40 family metallo-hydrolase [bacterium]
MRRMLVILLVCLLVSPAVELFSLTKKELLHKVRQYRESNQHKIIDEFLELLSIPNVSSDKANIRKNAVHIVKMLKKRGVASRVMESDGNPLVYGEINVPGASRTLLIYVHYDGQPVDPSHWSGTHPFKPVLRPGKLKKAGTNDPKPIPLPKPGESFNENWRLYGRSTSDDKAPLIGLMTALDALKKAGIPLKNNIKFIFEGEEEAGSTNLKGFLEKNK